MLGGIIKWMSDGFISRKIMRYGPSETDLAMIEEGGGEEATKFKDMKPTDTEFEIPADKEFKASQMRPAEKQKLIDAVKERINSNGILFASGLVAGEAIMGVIIAVLVIIGWNVSLTEVPAEWPGLLVFTYIGFLIMYMLLRQNISHLRMGEMIRIVKDEIKVFIGLTKRGFR
jgi:hypothetical protein